MNEVKLKMILKAIDEKKGEQVEVHDVRGVSPFFDRIVIVTMMNVRNGEAIADEIAKVCAGIGEPIRNVEGRRSAQWILIDAGDVLIHLFSEEERIRVNLSELIVKTKRRAEE